MTASLCLVSAAGHSSNCEQLLDLAALLQHGDRSDQACGRKRQQQQEHRSDSRVKVWTLVVELQHKAAFCWLFDANIFEQICSTLQPPGGLRN